MDSAHYTADRPLSAASAGMSPVKKRRTSLYCSPDDVITDSVSEAKPFLLSSA